MMRGDGLTLCQGMFRLGIMKKFVERVARYQHRLPGVTIPGVSQSHGDVTLRDVGTVGWAGGLGGLFQPSWCHQ